LPNKTGINPCYPYNAGVRQAKGDIIVLASPETLHTSNMFEVTSEFKRLDSETYFCMSVFCTTNEQFNKEMISDLTFESKLDVINSTKPKFSLDLGKDGRESFNNIWGSWYLHSQYRKTERNFFTALSKDLYYRLSGFDERFRNGTGYDDDEFKERVAEVVKEIIYFDDAVGIHLNHEIVNNMPPTTNSALYRKTRIDKYVSNDTWGQ